MQDANALTLFRASRRSWRKTLNALPWRYYLGFTIGRGAGFVLLPIAAQILGPAGLGQLEVALAVMIAATIVLDAGLGAALVRYWHDETIERRELVSSAIGLQIAAAAVASVLFAPLSLTLGFGTSDQLILMMAIVAFSLVEGLAVLGSAMLRSEQRDRAYLGLSVVRLVVTAGLGSLGVIALGVPGALLGIALGGIGFALLPTATLLNKRSLGTRGLRRRLARYGFPLVATTAATWSLALSDRLFLQAFASSAEIGQYSANYRLGSLVLAFIAAPFAMAWLPVAQRISHLERAGQVRRWAVGFSVLALGATGILVGMAWTVVPIVFGSDFNADAAIVALVGVSGWGAGLYYLVATPLLVGDSTRIVSLCACATIAINLVLTPAMIAVMGVDGAAVSTALSYAALCGTAWAGVRYMAHREARS